MPISGLIAGRMSEAFEDLVKQRFLEEERREAQRQREYENALRLQQMEETRAEREAARAYQKRQEERDIKRDIEARTGRTLENLMRTHDPTIGAPLVVPPELAAATAGTEFAPLIEQRQIFPEATVGEMGPEPGTPRTEAQLRKTTAMRAAEEAARKQREQEVRLAALAGRTDLPPETQAFVGLGPEFAGKLQPENLIPTAELERREKAESQRRIQEALATRAPREPEQPDVYLERKLPSGEVQSTLETNANARRLLQSGQGWAIPGKGTAAGGGKGPGAEGRAALKRALPVLNEVKALSEQINVVPQEAYRGLGGAVAKVKGLGREVSTQAGFDPTLQEYQGLIYGFTPMIARALGHVGVLTQQDVESVYRAFPRAGESKEVAARKLARVERLMSGLSEEELATLPLMPDYSAPTPWGTLDYIRQQRGGKPGQQAPQQYPSYQDYSGQPEPGQPPGQ
jgi:hypothetical protein